MDSAQLWTYIQWGAWAISALLAALMIIDWMRVESQFSEEALTSSREGEIEATSEKHDLGR